jgi:hypothetical protein
MTARNQIETLRQVSTVDKYVVKFQSISIKTGYGEAELLNKFIRGLKQHIRDQCFKVYPMPERLQEWMEMAVTFQRQEELQNSFKQGTFFGTKQSPPKNTQTPGRTFPGSGEPMQVDRQRKQCNFCKKFGHTMDTCRRKLGLCIRCGNAGHMIKDCPQQPTKIRETVTVEEDFQEDQ